MQKWFMLMFLVAFLCRFWKTSLSCGVYFEMFQKTLLACDIYFETFQKMSLSCDIYFETFQKMLQISAYDIGYGNIFENVAGHGSDIFLAYRDILKCHRSPILL